MTDDSVSPTERRDTTMAASAAHQRGASKKRIRPLGRGGEPAFTR
jgi:hypothetical protein